MSRGQNVVPLRASTIATAREVIRRPDHHSDAAVLDACETLITFGDWMDQTRATHLRQSLIRQGVVRLNAEARRVLHRRLLALCAVTFSLGFATGLFVAGLFIDFLL